MVAICIVAICFGGTVALCSLIAISCVAKAKIGGNTTESITRRR